MELIKGRTYLCVDGEIRRLDAIEDDFLYYSVPVGDRDSRVSWMKLGRTNRYQVESDFTDGKIISEDEI